MDQKRVEILPAQTNHLQDIQRLAEKIWRDHYPGIISVEQINYMLTHDYDLVTLKKDLANDIRFERLLIDQELKGFASWGPAVGDAETARLHKIYLEVSLHGQGLGSRLLSHVEDLCRTNNYKQVSLQVNRQNLKAIRAYERNGYHREKKILVDIGNGFVMDDYLMIKKLPPG